MLCVKLVLTMVEVTFFIYDMNGTNLMHPIFPEYEGKNLINFTDIHGKRVVEDHVKMMREKGEGFSQWWYPKPDNKDEAFEKNRLCKIL